ncbi:hypothetical protein [Nonomuraea dietziae]|uniref:hypothetical protein n=1 Tax=Nonomuraea dietziae TaxID=65515 RepID=UPI00341F8EAE
MRADVGVADVMRLLSLFTCHADLPQERAAHYLLVMLDGMEKAPAARRRGPTGRGRSRTGRGTGSTARRRKEGPGPERPGPEVTGCRGAPWTTRRCR